MDLTTIQEYFEVLERSTDYVLHCKVCNAGWTLRKISHHTANVLHLLEHAYSHTDMSEWYGPERGPEGFMMCSAGHTFHYLQETCPTCNYLKGK